MRGSYASVTSGKIADDNYGYISAFDKRVGWNGQSAFAFGNILIDQNIKPQTTDSWEIGTNLVFLRNRINLDVAYFNARDYNQLERVPLSEGSGYKFFQTNGNVYKRKGIEFTLSADVIKRQISDGVHRLILVSTDDI